MSGRSRRTLYLLAASAAIVALTLSAVAPAQNAQQRLRAQRNLPDLIVSAVQEPPDFAKPGDTLILTLTVANEGNTRARRSTVTRVLLSEGRAPTPDDIRMQGSARIPALGPGQEFTRQIRATIPANTPIDAYYLVACADTSNRVREHAERLLNCKLSGQAVDLRDRPVGPPGATGPPGPAGAAGTKGDVRTLPRTELDLGDKLFEPDTSPGNDEGSTQTSDALVIGPMTIRYLCRQTTNGDGGEPSDPFGASNSFDEDGDEAKVLLYTSDGTFSFSSANGQRMNIPAGNGTPDQDDEGGGEGKRQVLSAMHDPDPNTTFHGGSGNFEGGGEEDQPEYMFGFKSSSAYVAHSGGTEFVLHAWAGIDVLGVGNDRCVFGGSVQVVQG